MDMDGAKGKRPAGPAQASGPAQPDESRKRRRPAGPADQQTSRPADQYY